MEAPERLFDCPQRGDERDKEVPHKTSLIPTDDHRKDLLGSKPSREFQMCPRLRALEAPPMWQSQRNE